MSNHADIVVHVVAPIEHARRLSRRIATPGDALHQDAIRINETRENGGAAMLVTLALGMHARTAPGYVSKVAGEIPSGSVRASSFIDGGDLVSEAYDAGKPLVACDHEVLRDDTDADGHPRTIPVKGETRLAEDPTLLPLAERAWTMQGDLPAISA